MPSLSEFLPALCFGLLVCYVLHFIPSFVYLLVLSLVIISVLRSSDSDFVQQPIVVVDPDHPSMRMNQSLCGGCGRPVGDEFEALRNLVSVLVGGSADVR